MYRVRQTIFIIPLVFSLTFSSVLCCCVVQFAYAKNFIRHNEHTLQTSKSNHCGPHNPQDHHSGNEHECQCPNLLSILEKNFSILNSTDIVLLLFNHNLFTPKVFFGEELAHIIRFNRSPPQFGAISPPLYLKNFVIRI